MKTSGHYDNVVFLYNYCSSTFFVLSFPMTIHSVLNTSVNVSGGALHYLLRKTSLMLCYVGQVRLCYVRLRLLGQFSVMLWLGKRVKIRKTTQSAFWTKQLFLIFFDEVRINLMFVCYAIEFKTIKINKKLIVSSNPKQT